MADNRFFEKFPEIKAQSGIGSALYVQEEDGLYGFVLPLETTPGVGTTPESIDIDVTTEDYIGKIPGKSTLEDKENEFFYHRDSIRRLMSLKGSEKNWLVINSDMTGNKFTATLNFVPNDGTSGDPLKGTMKLTPKTIDGYVDNVYPLLKPTARPASALDNVIKLASGATYTIPFITNPADATITATVETSGIATASITDGNLVITASSAGSTVIAITISKTGYYNWVTTTLVIVE